MAVIGDMPQVSSKKVDAVAARLRQQILDGHWELDAKLPVESELAESFACSISTISKAMGLLVHEGLVERKARAGTRVISQSARAQAKETDLDSFAFIYPAERHEGIWRAAKGFQDQAHDNDQRVLLLSTGMDYHKEAEFMLRLTEFAVRGAVVYPNLVSSEAQAVFVKVVAASKFPIVLTAPNPLGLNCPTVSLDGFHAGYTTTRHLIAQGCRRIGYLSDRARSISMRERYIDYRRAIEDAGIEAAAEWVRLNPSMNADLVHPMVEPEIIAADYLNKAIGIDAVVCSTDFLAVGVINVALRQGLRIPADLRVVGMDDYDFSAKAEVPLTTYRIPYEEIGRCGFQMLDDALNGRLAPGTERLLRGALVTRSSG